MQSVEISGLSETIKKLDAAPEIIRQARAEFFEEAGASLLSDVQGRIGGTGKITGVQEYRVGSGKGYVAVRAKADTYQTTKSGKRYAVGYVTNAIEGGHRHGGPRGGKGYRPRYRKAAVPGKWFYQAVRQDVDEMGQEEVDALMELIVRGLEGSL